MVEGVEGSVGRDGETEAVAGLVVLDRDAQRVVAEVPTTLDVDAVALAAGGLAGLVVVGLIAPSSKCMTRR